MRHPRLIDSYDWVVLGDSLPALLSGVLVARMGLSVLVVGEGSARKWSLSSTGQILDPEPNWVVGLGSPSLGLGLAGECFRAVGVAPSEWGSIQGNDTLLQATTPSIRSHWWRLLVDTRREVSRESGDAGHPVARLTQAVELVEASTRRFWSGLPDRLTLDVEANAGGGRKKSFGARKGISRADSFFSESQFLRHLQGSLAEKRLPEFWATEWDDFREKLALESASRDLGFGERSREWIEAWLAGVLGSEVPDRISGAEALQALALSLDGVRIHGGVGAFRSLLHRLLLRFGAHVVEESVQVSRLFIEEGRILGLQLSGSGQGRTLTRARGVLVSRHPERLRSWMRGDGILRDLKDPDGRRVTLGVTVEPKGLPPGMGQRLIWRESGSPTLEIERARPEEYGFPATGEELLFVRACFPAGSEGWSIERWRTVLARMFRQAAELLPFLEERSMRIFPDFRSPHFPKQWAEAYGGGSLRSREVLRVALSRLRPSEFPKAEGLFSVHRSADPGLGLMGEWAAAIKATAWIAHRSGLRGPLG